VDGPVESIPTVRITGKHREQLFGRVGADISATEGVGVFAIAIEESTGVTLEVGCGLNSGGLAIGLRVAVDADRLETNHRS
jgi:hypothetical protein